LRSPQGWQSTCNRNKCLFPPLVGEKLNPSEDGEALPEVLQSGHHNTDISVVREYLPLSSLRPHWFAAYTMSRHEKRAAEYFQQRDIPFFLPLYRSRCKWKDGSKTILELPLFPGYIFVNIPLANRVRVLEVPGVLSLVSCGRTPVPLPELEIKVLREGLRASKAEPHPYLVAGERVRINTGPLNGMEGVLLRKNNGFRVVITLQEIMKSVVVEVEESELEHAR
jgi:transcription antitermination factor NusG